MELLPDDLGMRRRMTVALLRAGSAATQQVGPNSSAVAAQAVTQAESLRSGYSTSTGSSDSAPRKTSTGPYSRFLMRTAGLPESAGQGLLGSMSGTIGGIAGGIGGGFGGGFMIPALIMLMVGKLAVGIPFFLIGLLGLIIGFVLPALLLRDWARKPVTASELKALAEAQAGDILEVSYLELGRDLLMNPPQDEIAEQRLKDTYQALGEAIDRLPPPGSVVADIPALHIELAEVQKALEAETDPVIRESRERRAVTIEQTIRSAERAERNNRRVAALREELTSQVRALRLGFSDRSESRQDTATLDTLAESVRRIQTEADALSDARAELDATLIPNLSAPWHTVKAETEEKNTEQVVQIQGR